MNDKGNRKRGRLSRRGPRASEGLSLPCVMVRFFAAAMAVLVVLSPDLARAQQATQPGGALAQQAEAAAVETVPRAPAPLAPNPEFANFPRYTGTLGSRRIILRLGKKTDDPTGVHGEYQFADTGEVVLVAGDREGDVLEIEESNDGSTITGNWVGRFAADGALAGDRMNVDDSDPQSFDLHPLVGSSSTL